MSLIARNHAFHRGTTIYEPDLDDVLKQCCCKNLFFGIDVEKHVYDFDIGFVSVNTRTITCSLGAGSAAEESTIPIKTAEAIEKRIKFCQIRNSFQPSDISVTVEMMPFSWGSDADCNITMADEGCNLSRVHNLIALEVAPQYLLIPEI
ncbi:UDP-glucose 6-dehydrogenase [Medicago truncatula]|uniref:UDP-glucose 6-dehydrogenase n=1 Tax=Medicago truncatula TaxID=3880 RepID=G7KMC3_MEDTR|nr:UDP-glucose 6-dehydrogenase [Medicago truncatula]